MFKPKCSKQELLDALSTSTTLIGIKRQLPAIKSWVSFKSHLEHYQIDTSQLLGHGWNKGLYDYSKFQKGKVVSSAMALPALVHKRGHQCEICGNTHWLDQLIPLEVHHKDGDKLNNEESNLELMCPNCHALTDNYRGRNINNKPYISEAKFIEALESSPNIRQALLKLGLTAKGSNYTRARELIDKHNLKFNIKST